VLPHLQPAQAELLRDRARVPGRAGGVAAGQALPRGHIHADLFRDNVMFDATAGDDRLCGFFDFYFRRHRHAAVRPRGVPERLVQRPRQRPPGRGPRKPFVAAYEGVRPLDGGERRLLPALLRAAALRFWLSRLWDWHLPRDAALLQPKDPASSSGCCASASSQPWHPPPKSP
jgi:homoserine kinase type II